MASLALVADYASDESSHDSYTESGETNNTSVFCSSIKLFAKFSIVQLFIACSHLSFLYPNFHVQ